MEEEMTFLGSSKVSTNMRVSIVQDAVAVLKVNVGDHVVFYKNKRGEIVIKKA